MAEKLLKRSKKKVVAKKAAPATKSFADGVNVIVGTYREKQLAWIRKHRVYNYPVDADVPYPKWEGVKELWLYAGAKSKRTMFTAEFAGVQTRAEFIAANPTYAKLGPSRHKKYAVYKIVEELDYASRLDEPVAFARIGDFTKRTPKIAKAIKSFYADGQLGSLADYLPTDLTQLPRAQLRVCEPGVQLDFMFGIYSSEHRNSAIAGDGISTICKALGCVHGKPGWPDGFGSAVRHYLGLTHQHPIRTLSLFSGAGGLDIGFSDVGFDVVESVEIERKFCDTLELNSGVGKRFEHSKVNCVDIRKFSGDHLGHIDFIIGGPPCQTFSAAGRRANGVLGTTDERGVLFREYVRLLDELSPRGFLFENVYGLTGAQGGEAWREIKESFAKVGYRIFHRILNAADYGVPQHRERLIIVGLKDGDFRFPRPTHGPDSMDQTPYYDAGTAVCGVRLSDMEKRSGLGGRFGHLLDDIPPGMNYSFYTREMGHPHPVFAWRSKFSDFLYKADPAAPVRTIKAQGGAYTGPLHWGNRFFAYPEYKRLQTFPDNYEISGGKQTAIKQIGNSVPPQLARMLAIAIRHQVFGTVFPFEMSLLSEDERLTFRSRKLGMMEAYRAKAKKTISAMPRKRSSLPKEDEKYCCRLTDRFLFEKCGPGDAQFDVKVNWGTELKIEIQDRREPDTDSRQRITVSPSRLTWDMPFADAVLSVKSHDPRAFTVAWKAFERALAEHRLKADLIQLNGYYQYEPEMRCAFEYTPSFAYGSIVAGIVSGRNVRRIVSEKILADEWGVESKKVVDVATMLRGIGYEIRNHNTNPQIEEGQWLIPYSFPTLNSMSVQLGKKVQQ